MGSQNALLTKTVVALPPASYANTTAANAAVVEVDARGFRWALVTLNSGSIGTSIDATLQASATSGSGHADISGADFTQNTTDDTVATILVDTKGTARYLQLDMTLSGTCVAGATVTLFESTDTANVGSSEHDAVVTF